MPQTLRRRRATPLALAATATVALAAPAHAVELSAIAAGGEPGFVINGEAAFDYAGFSVSAAGDVNGDGLGDVIVGADRNDTSGYNSGRAYVVFGKSSFGAIELTDIGGASGFAITAPNDGDRLGISVSAAGDVNGDGLGDLVVGAYLAELGAYPAGGAFIVLGKTTGTTVDLGTLGGDGYNIIPDGYYGQVGFSVSGAGDANGDGLADVIVSAHTFDADGNDDSGRSYVVFGSTLSAPVQLSSVGAGIGGFAIDGEAFNDFSGRSVSGAGDVNGDGLSDVIVGAFGADAGGYDSGKAYVVFGKTGGTTVKLSAVAAGAGGGFAMLGTAAYDYAGRSVSSAGDMNSDGLSEIIVGAPKIDVGGSNRGRSYVVFGRTATAPIQLSDVGGAINGFVVNGQANNDESGTAVASAGDFSGDGRLDLIVGAPNVDFPGADSGRSYVVFGKATTAAVNLSAVSASNGGEPLIGVSASDRTGRSVSAAGDVNGDGLGDVIVGAPEADPGGVTTGRAFVVFSTASIATPNVNYKGIIAAGDAPRVGIGTHRFGGDRTVFPASRCWVDYGGGATATQTTVLLSPTDVGVGGGFNLANVANVYWVVSETRASMVSKRVTVRYTNAEITGLAEGSLAMYHTLGNLSGPWALSGSQVLDAARNEVTGTVNNGSSIIVLATVPPDSVAPNPIITRLNLNPTANQNPQWRIDFTEAITGVVTTDEITPTGTLAGAVDNLRVEGTDQPFTVTLYTNAETANGTLGFTLAASAVTDLVGNNSTAAGAPSYTVNEVGAGFAGDVNKDSFVNVADVTALADHIVNGTPLP